jgi:geranylgeranyl reductase family protein
MATRPTELTVDVVVVGGGPGGATAAAWLAAAGRDVLVLEKERFPRDKVCGDGLTPRVVQELLDLGLHDEATGRADGWATQKGLRIHGGHTVMELPWPELEDWPAWGATCSRMVLDKRLADHAVERGAGLWTGVTVTDVVWRDDRNEDRVAGVRWIDKDTGEEGVVRAAVVIAADGASGKLARSIGLHRRADRPMAVAARGYWESPRADDEWISSFLDLHDADGNLLSGYGWVFPLDGGQINVGLGLLNTSEGFGKTNYRKMLEGWATGMADEWGTTPDAQRGRLMTSPIPMGFNRTPLHRKGLLLVGDSGGMVNPFNGEGISYAMESAKLAADVIDRSFSTQRTATLDAYDTELRARWGGYYTLGNVFTHLVGNPAIMHVCTEYGMPIRPLMEMVLKLMAHLTDADPSDTKDLVINTLTDLTPAA